MRQGGIRVTIRNSGDVTKGGEKGWVHQSTATKKPALMRRPVRAKKDLVSEKPNHPECRVKKERIKHRER